MNDLIYVANLKTGVTECKVQNCKKDFMRITDKILSQYPEYLRPFYKFIAYYRCEEIIKDEYVGKSVCSSADTFNERYGKDIARTKAIIKRESAFQTALEAISNDIELLAEINASIDREDVLDKHLNNMCALLENEQSLAKIRGYEKDDELDFANELDLNKNYSPHCCSLCGKTFLNYLDDKDYLDNEHSWWPIDLPNGNKLEVCSTCMDTLKKLSN